MTLFGEEKSESPRLPSPWRAISSSTTPSKSATPSPLNLSAPGTPLDHTDSEASLPSDAPSLEDDLEAFSFADDGDFEIEPLQDLDESVVDALSPEVDKSGNIEYKLKLLTPSPLRLAKLVTQLRWRLVEGGGVALYELGILDNGTLVGLSFEEMKESLETLGKMLRCLGGGEVRVGRVVRLGARKGRRSDSFGGAMDDAILEIPTSPLFDNLIVEASHGTENLSFPPMPTQELPPIDLNTSTINAQPGPTRQGPVRTPEERALLRRQKRDSRREKREKPAPIPVVPRAPKERREWVPRDPSKPKPIPPRHPPKERSSSKLTKKEKYLLSQSAPVRSALFGSPPTGRGDGEIRYVVEAVVMKRRVATVRRSTGSEGVASGESEDVDAELEQDRSDSDDEEEGWRYLEFDNFHVDAAAQLAKRKGSL